MAHSSFSALILLSLLAVVAAVPAARAGEKPAQTFTLPNGLTVVLQEDHRLPQVVIATRYGVGSKDEAPGRSGFAHLFEHLMFMGTNRVPGNQFDMLMESGGGENNASTSTDRTTYYSLGPSSLLPTLLWLDADRLEALGEAMTQEKVDLQRDVVRNERRQTVENTPYGVAELILPEAVWPQGHPYHHSVIGSHEDLQAATLQDVKDFFATWYVPANAVLVVVGDFDPLRARETIEKTFGAIPARPVARRLPAPPAGLEAEVRRIAVDKVEFPRLYLVWHSPATGTLGDAGMELLARWLAGSPSSRLDRRLMIDRQLAQTINAYQDSRELGSEFHIEITAAPGGDLEEIKREVLTVLEELRQEGPRPEELSRLQANFEANFRRRQESLLGRAISMTDYYYFTGRAEAFDRDLARYTGATAPGLRDLARQVFGEGRVDLRILPAAAQVEGASLDRRPADFSLGEFAAPPVQRFQLANGIPVEFISRPGTGLFSGALIVEGGERLIEPGKAGLGILAAAMLTAGAGGKNPTEYAAALEGLGAGVAADVNREAFVVEVQGLTGKLGPTLDLFADAILRPNLTEADFRREAGLQVARIEARADNPVGVANLVSRALLFGGQDYRGRPLEGYASTVKGLAPGDVSAILKELVHPAAARFLLVGDFDQATLARELGQRFGSWNKSAPKPASPPPAAASAPETRFALVDVKGAPQTVIFLRRQVAAPDDDLRSRRACLNTLFGGSFTSRLMQNLRERHGYTYGARSMFREEGTGSQLIAFSSVQTAVTGAALAEFKSEFLGLSGGNVTAPELEKAVKTTRRNLVETVETTSSLAQALLELALSGRPPEALARDIKGVDRVTLEGINAAAKSGDFRWEDLSVLLVGDREQVLPQLEKAGFPKPVLVDEEGRRLSQ